MKKILLSLFFLGLSAHELEELERISMHGQHTIAANKTILKTILAKHGNKADYLLSRWIRNGCFETTNNRSMIPSNLHRVCKEQIVEDGELSTDRFFKYIAIGNKLYGGNINGTLRNIRANIERNSAIFENQLEDLPAINSLDPTNMIINLQCFTVSPQGNFIASNAIVNEDGALDNYAITFEETDESDVLEEEAFWHEDISSHSTGTLISEDNKTLVFNPSRPDCFITSEYWGNHKRYVNQEILALGKKKIWLKDGDHLLLTKILPHGEETFWSGWPILPKLEGDSEAATNLLIFNRMRPEDSYGNLLEIEKIAHDIKANILLMLTTNSYTGDKEIMLYQAYG